ARAVTWSNSRTSSSSPSPSAGAWPASTGWVRMQRRSGKRSARLPPSRRLPEPSVSRATFERRLDELGIANPRRSDNLTRTQTTRILALLRRFIREHGWAELRSDTELEGVALGRFVSNARRRNRHDRVSDWLREELEAIPGWTW